MDQDAETFRTYVQNVRDGGTPGPKTLKWMQAQADAMGLDLPTLVSGSNAASAWGGAKAGASFGFNDELAGALAAAVPGGQDYTEARDESRRKHASMQFMDPRMYAGAELGAGVATSFVPVAGWAGKGAQVGNTALRAMTGGAAVGAADAYGRQEGSNNPMNSGVAAGAGLGAAGGLAGHTLGRIFSRSARTGRAAQAELNKIMTEHGIDADQAIAGLADGSLTSRNQTLLMEARAAYNNASTGVKGAVVSDVKQAAGRGRVDVIDALDDEIRPDLRGRTTAPQFEKATAVPDVDARYADAYAAGNARLAQDGVSQEMYRLVEEAQFLDPASIGSINSAARAAWVKAGRPPSEWSEVVEMADGRMQWNRQPSAEELAEVSRGVRAQATKGYKAGEVEAPAVDVTGRGIREEAGRMMPEWDEITREVAQSKDMQDAYEMARKVKGSKEAADRFLDVFPSYSPSQKAAAQAALREEVMARMQKAGPTAMPMRPMMPAENGLDPHMYTVLREVFPGAQLDAVMAQAQGRQELFNMLTTNSPTHELQAISRARYGGGQGVADAVGVGADMMTGGMAGTAIEKGRNLVQRVAHTLGLGQRTADVVLEALTTEQPEVLQRALTGDPEAAALIGRIMQQMASTTGANAASDALPIFGP